MGRITDGLTEEELLELQAEQYENEKWGMDLDEHMVPSEGPYMGPGECIPF